MYLRATAITYVFLYIGYCFKSINTKLQYIDTNTCLAKQLKNMDHDFHIDTVIHDQSPDIIVQDKGTKNCHTINVVIPKLQSNLLWKLKWQDCLKCLNGSSRKF